jgi:murein L,D-transpeptidase YafK
MPSVFTVAIEMVARRCGIVILGIPVVVGVVCGVYAREPGNGQTVLADKILLEKSARRLALLRAGKPIRSYQVSLGGHPVGPKEREGDGRTPEGLYRIDRRILRSSFHRALHISYPNAADRAHAAALRSSPGGDIMIHGLKNGLGWIGPLHRLSDWTQGCIAVTNAEIEEIWIMVRDGTPIEIVP